MIQTDCYEVVNFLNPLSRVMSSRSSYGAGQRTAEFHRRCLPAAFADELTFHYYPIRQAIADEQVMRGGSGPLSLSDIKVGRCARVPGFTYLNLYIRCQPDPFIVRFEWHLNVLG
jgi:hypothetical protein